MDQKKVKKGCAARGGRRFLMGVQGVHGRRKKRGKLLKKKISGFQRGGGKKKATNIRKHQEQPKIDTPACGGGREKQKGDPSSKGLHTFDFGEGKEGIVREKLYGIPKVGGGKEGSEKRG